MSCRERTAVQQLTEVAKDTAVGGPAEGAHIHVVHLSDPEESLDLIKVPSLHLKRKVLPWCRLLFSFTNSLFNSSDISAYIWGREVSMQGWDLWIHTRPRSFKQRDGMSGYIWSREVSCKRMGLHYKLWHALQEAKAVGSSMSVETSPHYLAFAAEEIPDGETQFKCNPPIRHADYRELLWKALQVWRFYPSGLLSIRLDIALSNFFCRCQGILPLQVWIVLL